MINSGNEITSYGCSIVVATYEVAVYCLTVKTICYCFNYTDADIADDVLENRGRSSIEEKIAKAKKNGTCQCDIKNPKKR
jgi:hypothetical protein